LSRWKCVGRTVWFDWLFVVDVNLFEFDQTLFSEREQKMFVLAPSEQCANLWFGIENALHEARFIEFSCKWKSKWSGRTSVAQKVLELWSLNPLLLVVGNCNSLSKTCFAEVDPCLFLKTVVFFARALQLEVRHDNLTLKSVTSNWFMQESRSFEKSGRA
jgi:hypothetical protein